MKKEAITNCVIIVVVLLWAASIIMGMRDRSYQIPGTLQLIMTAVAAFLFGKQVVERARAQGELDNKEDEEDKRKKQ